MNVLPAGWMMPIVKYMYFAVMRQVYDSSWRNEYILNEN